MTTPQPASRPASHHTPSIAVPAGEGDASAAARLTIRAPEDLLAAAPILLGFHPEESLVVLTFGPQPFHARLDLPPPGLEDDWLTPVDAAIARHGVEAVALLAYTEDRDAARRVLTRARERWDRAARLRVIATLAVGRSSWVECFDAERAGEAAGGAVPDPTAHPFAAQAVFAGRVTHASRADVEASLAPDADAVARLRGALSTASPASPGWVRVQLTDATSVADPGPGDETTWSAEVVAAALLSLATPEGLAEAVVALEVGRGRGQVEWLRRLVRSSPPELTAGPSAALAVASWLAGDGALAWCAVDRCLDVSPGHPLGVLVGDCLSRAVPPWEWKTEVLRAVTTAAHVANQTGDPGPEPS